MPKIEITLNDQLITQFTRFSMVKAIDAVGAGFSFTAPFFPEDQAYRDLYKPFKYQAVKLKINGELQLTGRVEKIDPTLGDRSQVVVKGRSKTGSLIDSTFKYGQDLQFTGADLKEISARLMLAFDFGDQFDDSAGAIFEEESPSSPTQNVFGYLHNLASQRQLLMSQTPEGDLLYRRARVKGAPRGEYVEGDVGLVVTGGSYDGTKRFPYFDTFGQEQDVNDNYVRVYDPAITAVRPKSVMANSTNSANIIEAGEWVASSAVAQSINIPLQVEGWTDRQGKVWEENTLILLTAPSIMVYKPFTFLIRSVKFTQTDTKTYTTLGLTIPSAYTGKLPKAYPWD